MRLVVLLACLATSAHALEIRADGKGSRMAYFLMNDDRDVLGTFWSPFTGESDYGFSAALDSQLAPVWSPDRSFVAVAGGTMMHPRLFVYRAADNTLAPVRLPAAIGKSKDGFAIEGWKDNSILVLSGLVDDSRMTVRIEGASATVLPPER